ncbi:MAG: hypothetical protein ACD_72C00120G0001, partial [uncultured bacterium]
MEHNFLKSIFLGDQSEKTPTPTTESPKTESQPDKVDLDRRNFLKMGLGLAVGATLGLEGKAFAETGKELSEKEIHDSQEKLTDEMMAWSYSVETDYGLPESRSMTEKDLVRKMMLESGMPKKIERLFLQIAKIPNYVGRLTNIYEYLKDANCHGLFLTYANKAGLTRAQIGFSIDTNVPNFYSIHTKDFLPSAKNVSAGDMDSRQNPHPEISLSEEIAAYIVADLINKFPAWSSKEKKAKFLEIINDPKIRKIAEAHDMTIAEFYSLIKATVSYEEEHGAGEGREAIVKRIISEQQSFHQREILGPNTAKLITIAGDHGFSNNETCAVASAVGIADNRVVKFTVEKDSDCAKITQGFLKSISDCPERTTIFVNAHGQMDHIHLSRHDNGDIPIEIVAKTLIDKVIISKNPEILGSMTFVFDNCLSYNFAKALVKAMKKIHDGLTDNNLVDFSKIKMPTIITAAHEASPSYIGHSINNSLKSQIGGIRKERAVTGRRLAQEVQPDIYRDSDLTIFSGQNG